MTEATDLVLTLFACSKSALPTNIPSIRSVIITELNDAGFISASRKSFSKMYTKFRHCKTSCSLVGFSDCFEDPDGHLWTRGKGPNASCGCFHGRYLSTATVCSRGTRAGS